MNAIGINYSAGRKGKYGINDARYKLGEKRT